jgi:hypothetical protein
MSVEPYPATILVVIVKVNVKYEAILFFIYTRIIFYTIWNVKGFFKKFQTPYTHTLRLAEVFGGFFLANISINGNEVTAPPLKKILQRIHF